MSKRDDKAGSPLRQTKLTIQQQKTFAIPLAQLEDELHKLLSGYQFYDHAVTSLTQPDDVENEPAERFAFGVFLYQQQLRQQGQQTMEALQRIQQMVN